jgi:uncharacterized phage protein (TIGR02218 family)
MKTISTNLKNHLAQETTTTCTLWKITRTDSQVFGFTDSAADVLYNGLNYVASTGHAPSSIQTNSTLSVDNLEVQSILDSTSITESDIQAGIWDFAEVLIMIVNYKDLSMGDMILRRGWLGNIKTGANNFTAELRGMMQPLQQVIGRVYTAACSAQLGDSACGINTTGYTYTGTVESTTDSRTFVDSLIVAATGYYNGGIITWTSGLNNTYKMEVKSNIGSSVVLQLGMPNPIQIGDSFTIVAGCDKTLATCKAKFNNVINFRGFPHIPGYDKMLAGK